MKTKHWIYIAISIIIFLILVIFSPKISLLLPSAKAVADSPIIFSFVIMLAAILDSINPCAFSVLFLTIIFLFSLKKDRTYILKTGGLYILGIFLVYLLIGIGMLQALSLFNISNGIAKIGALILIATAIINILGDLIPNFPIKLKIPNFAHARIGKLIEKDTPVTAIILGIVVGMFEFPCTGGPYLFILSLLHSKETFNKGLIYLIFYNIIFVAPLIIALFMATTKNVAEKIDELRRKETKQASIILSVIMILLGLFVLLV